jgi:predicted CXXCH cytochrome family protein
MNQDEHVRELVARTARGNGRWATGRVRQPRPGRLPGTVMACLLLAATHAGAVEHPGVVPKDGECASCHVEKVRGKSVHSAMATPCTVCHVSTTRGDMTTVSLSMPKTKICFACHEESVALRQHVPTVKGQCVDCHDAHSSDRKMLLLGVAAPVPDLKRK